MLIDFQIPNPPFSQYFTTEFSGAETLTINEKELVANAAGQRVKHFSTGRLCAKNALAVLGIPDAEILRDEDKAPVWPKGVVGSISHSKQMAGAVAASADSITGIGLDIETIGSVKADMWDVLFLPSEQRFLNTFRGDELALYSTLFFSGKEAFYKFQHPVTKTFLDFTDAEISTTDSIFKISPVKGLPGQGWLAKPVTIHYSIKNDQVITLCYR